MTERTTLRIEPAPREAWKGKVARLVLTRPEVHNAFDDRLIAELSGALEELAATPGLRVVVLEGEGRSFCAGADLNWMKRSLAYSAEENRRDASAMAAMFRRLSELPFAVAGRIHGAAIGGGVGLVACCDIALAAESAKFGLAEVKLGILPAVISPFVLRKIGESAARELFLTGGRFGAVEAERIGLVRRVVPDDSLDDAIAAVVDELLTSGPEAVAAAKRLIGRVSGVPIDEALPAAVELICERRTSAEGQEGMTAFLEKRRPSWIS